MGKEEWVIELEKIFLKRKETEVFADFSWKVKTKEHWFIMGSNGCGKTSLLEIIMGYLWPQKGVVRVLGEQMGNVFIPDLRKQIGLVSPWIFKRMNDKTTVAKVVASGFDASMGYWGDVGNDLYQKVLKTLEGFHCSDLAERTFGALSSGQQFKVILARAIINSPQLLLLDEPFAQLDISARMEAYALVERLAQGDKELTVILISHHLEDVKDFYQHGLLFKNGRNYVSGLRQEMLILLNKDSAFFRNK